MEGNKVLYLCADRNGCHCHNCGECRHTSDLSYAKNWHREPTQKQLETYFDYLPVETEILPGGDTVIYGIYTEKDWI